MGDASGTDQGRGAIDPKARGIVDRGTGDLLAEVVSRPSEAELRRQDYLDAYRAGMILAYTEESLARDDIPTLLIYARQSADRISESHGPRTDYASAINLLTLYSHLLTRAQVSARDKDGTLLYQDRF